MIVETALLIKLIGGAKVIAAHGGLTSWLASNAAATASSAGLGAAAAQTVATVAGVGAAAAVVGGAAQVVDGLTEGRPLKAALGAGRAASGGHWIAGH